ncbi:MAG: hypothetical protein ACI936_001243 [Paraglaciecola sp.]|jgi:hypothetical protein
MDNKKPAPINIPPVSLLNSLAWPSAINHQDDVAPSYKPLTKPTLKGQIHVQTVTRINLFSVSKADRLDLPASN